ncbi:hypothetical protein, conserved [Leishmania tarentolae]|uniref:Uncharacterized protein n=1 Tax=Leishmania tarentolae TaxID=5689 RepID=A0A640L0B1_LEITA|nr:hypothetical protein, conserved [Leishmania tarentolae]
MKACSNRSCTSATPFSNDAVLISYAVPDACPLAHITFSFLLYMLVGPRRPKASLAAFRGLPTSSPHSSSRYSYRSHGATNVSMSSLAVAAFRSRDKSRTGRGRSSKRQQLRNDTSNDQGGDSLPFTKAAITLSPQTPEMPAATSDAASAHSRAPQQSKGVPRHQQKSPRTTSSRSHQSKKTSPAPRARRGGPSALPSDHRHASASRVRGGPVVPSSALRHSLTSSRSVRSISEEIALNRLQRAVRWFLMHRYLQRTVPVASVSASMPADAAPLFESRFLHCLRAEARRIERAEQLHKRTAARVIQKAFRRFAQMRKIQQRHLSIYRRVLPRSIFDPIRAAELEASLCSIQASLRMFASIRLAEARRATILQQTTATVLDQGCQTSSNCTVPIRQIHDQELREVLCRHETVERRDLLRRHFVFLVCCHQAFFNDPRMWDAGVAIRRIPLYTHQGLLSVDSVRMICDTTTPSLTSGTVDSVALRGDAAAEDKQTSVSPLPQQSLPFSANLTVHGCIKDWDSPTQPGPSLLEAAGSGWLAGKEGDSGYFDIDAAVRLAEHRFLLSADEWRLLKELKSLPVSPASLLFSSGAGGLVGTEVGALAAPPSQLHTAPDDAAGKESCSLNYAKAFASTLTFLRRPRIVDPSVRSTVQHLHDIRNSPLKMQQELRMHGYLFAAQVAPLLRLGLHHQELARGDADLSCFTTTPGMKAWRPLVAGRVACAATELRQCLIGAVYDSGSASESVLPVALEEQKISLKAAARAAYQTPSQMDASTSKLPLLRSTPTAALLREGFSNPATEELHHASANTTRRVGGADSAYGASYTASRQSSLICTAFAAEWKRRLASCADEVGPYWCEFLSSRRVGALVTTAGRKDKMPGEADAVYASGASVPSVPLPMRVRRGLESHLVRSAPSYLLQDFMPSLMRRHEHSGAAPSTRDAPTGSVVAAVERAGISRLSSVTTSTGTNVHSGKWWDAVERLLLCEYTNRKELLANEAAQRSSIDVLRLMAHASAGESVAEA